MRRSDVFIVAYLVVMIAAPLTYYLGLRASPTDERFAWRMFSSVRMDRCNVTVEETVRAGATTTTRDVPYRDELQLGWISHMLRRQPRVVDAFLARVCKDAGAVEAFYTRRCVGAGGAPAPVEELARRCEAAP